MAKLKIVLFSLFFSVVSNSLLSYEITDLIKILIEKNETNSKFKYDNLIEDKDLQNADTLYIPEIDYSFNISNNISSTTSTSNYNSDSHTLSATVNLRGFKDVPALLRNEKRLQQRRTAFSQRPWKVF